MPRKKTHQEFVIEINELYQGKLLVLGTYRGNREPIWVKYTECGHKKEGLPARLLKGQQCRECFIENLNKGKRKDESVFKEELKNVLGEEYELLSSYEGNNVEVSLFHTVCQETFTALPYNLTRGTGCPTCAGNKKGTTDSFKSTVYQLVKDEYEVKGEYQNARTPLTMKHNVCGHEYEVAPHNFKSGRRCPKCQESKGEKLLANVLKDSLPILLPDIPIQIKPQYKQEDCKDKRNLRFDFAVVDKKENPIFLIEFDGQQHYEPICFNGISKVEAEDRYLRTKHRDGLKNMYCVRNNIPLIRIPYWSLNEMSKVLEARLKRYVYSTAISV